MKLHLPLIRIVFSLILIPMISLIPQGKAQDSSTSININRDIENMQFSRINQAPDYLAMDLDVSTIEHLVPIIEETYQTSLITCGEAHITLITPPEFSVLKKYFSMNQLRRIFEEKRTQLMMKIHCLGQGHAEINGQQESTFYLVVKSTDFFIFRQKVQEMAEAKGLPAGSFNADSFYPHITLGFTKRDLHIQDGVVKNEDSCDRSLRLNQ